MSILSSVVLFLASVVAIVFSLLVLLTGKGDAMSGGGSVRTSYKGKATFDDIMSRAALYLGVSFMALVLLYNVLSARVRTAESMGSTSSVSQPITPPASNKAPAASNNAPATATNSPSTSTNTPVSNNAPAAASNAPVPDPKNPSANGASTPATNAPASNAPASNNATK